MHFSHFELPPGPSYVLRQLFSPKVAGYVTLFGCFHVGGKAVGIDIPLWTIVSSSVVAFPAVLYVQAEFQHWRDKRKAESLGARLPHKVSSRWPGGIDLIAEMMNVFKTGYLGESDSLGPSCVKVSVIQGDTMVDWLAEGGQTIDMHTLWTTRVSLLTSHYQYFSDVDCGRRS